MFSLSVSPTNSKKWCMKRVALPCSLELFWMACTVYAGFVARGSKRKDCGSGVVFDRSRWSNRGQSYGPQSMRCLCACVLCLWTPWNKALELCVACVMGCACVHVSICRAFGFFREACSNFLGVKPLDSRSFLCRMSLSVGFSERCGISVLFALVITWWALCPHFCLFCILTLPYFAVCQSYTFVFSMSAYMRAPNYCSVCWFVYSNSGGTVTICASHVQRASVWLFRFFLSFFACTYFNVTNQLHWQIPLGLFSRLLAA